MKHSCICCRNETVRVLVDFGPQPPSNRFELPGAREDDAHPLIVGQCAECDLVQLVDPMAPSMAKSRFEWISYNEPEGHLDDLVGRLRGLDGIDEKSRIIGLTYKDDTTLARFNRLGYDNTCRYDLGSDLGVNDACAGLESVQAAFTKSTVSALGEKHGTADLLLVRHVLEHAHEPLEFLRSLRGLVRPGGYMLFEMPDATKFMNACDYSFLWEEHITYLCAPTLARLVGEAGLAVEDVIVYPYGLEDSLIGIVRNEDAGPTSKPVDPSQQPDSSSFARRYEPVRESLQRRLTAWNEAGKRVAVFGAGHLAAKFINLYSLADRIECVIDDHPKKQGLLMPGSRVPILGSATLDDIDICLLALNVESERKVVAKYQSFVDRGGRFMSIFALNPKSVYEAAGA